MPVLLQLERGESDVSSTATPMSMSTSLENVSPMSSMSSESSSAVCEEPKLACGEESKLATLIRRECAFLKITGCTMMPIAERSSKSRRASVDGVTQCLRICVAGLPLLKRHKWQQPLSKAVAGALERVGCPVVVRRGELFA